MKTANSTPAPGQRIPPWRTNEDVTWQTKECDGMIRIAVLDDYQDVSLEMADWSPLDGRAEITVFNDHLSNFDGIVERLLPFDVICVMRERTPLPRSLIDRLPRLKLIASTGP